MAYSAQYTKDGRDFYWKMQGLDWDLGTVGMTWAWPDEISEFINPSFIYCGGDGDPFVSQEHALPRTR
jgi:hypothetical protein